MYNNFRHLFILGLVCAAIVHLPCCGYSVPCRTLLAEDSAANTISQVGPDSTQVKKMIEWIQTPTVPKWALTQKTLKLESVTLPAENFDVAFAPDAPKWIRSFVHSGSDGSSVRWLRHPYNTNDEIVPYFHLPADKKGVFATHTASRSVIVSGNNKLYSIKVGTNFPLGPDGPVQGYKADMSEDLEVARERSEMVEKIDERLGADDVLIVLREIAVVVQKDYLQGYSIRDLRPLQDGHYYFPAHEIPTVGVEIAKHLHEDYSALWEQAWAKQSGIAQAHQLIRYGFESEDINPQNYYIQMDKDFRPTGKLVYQDITDSRPFEAVVIAIGLGEKYLDHGSTYKCKAHGVEPTFKFSSSSHKFLSGKLSARWMRVHDEAYFTEIGKLLNIPKTIARTSEGISPYLNSPEGAVALRRFHHL